MEICSFFPFLLYFILILLCFSFLSFKASLSPFLKTQGTFDGLYPRVAQMKSLAVHLVPFLLLSLSTLTIGAFIQLLKRFGLTISMEETVSRAAYIPAEAVLQKGTFVYNGNKSVNLYCKKGTRQPSHICHSWFNEHVAYYHCVNQRTTV